MKLIKVDGERNTVITADTIDKKGENKGRNHYGEK